MNYSLVTWQYPFTVLAPEWFLDYVHGGLSMNLRSRMTYAPTPRIISGSCPGAGIFGDFPGRYQASSVGRIDGSLSRRGMGGA